MILVSIADVRLCAVTSCQMQLAVPNTCPSSVLVQRLGDPALGELNDALGVDPQQHAYGRLRTLAVAAAVGLRLHNVGFRESTSVCAWGCRRRGGGFDASPAGEPFNSLEAQP